MLHVYNIQQLQELMRGEGECRMNKCWDGKRNQKEKKAVLVFSQYRKPTASGMCTSTPTDYAHHAHNEG
jgi:hypothetical protein